MNSISNSELDYLDSQLLKYKHINHAIQVRRLELQSSASSDSGEIQARGSSISKPTEQIVMRISSDIKLKNLELFKETVEKFISELNEEQLEIFNLRWTKGTTIPYYSWIEIADLLHVSKPTIYRKRRVLLEKFAYLKS